MLNSKHILILRFSAMGDVAMSVPVIRALVAQYPNLKVTVATRAFFKPFFRGINNVEVLEVDFKGKYKGIFGLYKLSKVIRALKIDAVADIHNVLRTKIIKLFLIEKKVAQINKGRAEKKALTSGKARKQLKTTHQRYADVFSKLGYPIEICNPVFPESAKLSADLQKYVSQTNTPIIGIAPFAAFKGKMYPLDKMKQVIEALSKTSTIILFGGGKQEVELLNEIENNSQNTMSVAGKLTLDQELDVISNLDLMLAMDSGNAHIAAMLGVKTITIWGVTHPFAGFAPYNQPIDFALTANRDEFPLIPTSIYGNKQPEGYENASGSIAVKTIVSKIKDVLSKL